MLISQGGAGRAVGGSSSLHQERRDDDGDDCFLVDIPFPIPAQDIQFGPFPAADAECIRLHIWYYLVGNSSQPSCLPCSRSCEYAFQPELVIIIPS